MLLRTVKLWQLSRSYQHTMKPKRTVNNSRQRENSIKWLSWPYQNTIGDIPWYWSAHPKGHIYRVCTTNQLYLLGAIIGYSVWDWERVYSLIETFHACTFRVSLAVFLNKRNVVILVCRYNMLIGITNYGHYYRCSVLYIISLSWVLGYSRLSNYFVAVLFASRTQ